jgi:hypothetical protein
MVVALAIIGALVVAALVFRISGITSIKGGFEIGSNQKPPKQLDNK